MGKYCDALEQGDREPECYEVAELLYRITELGMRVEELEEGLREIDKRAYNHETWEATVRWMRLKARSLLEKEG